jgi:hypothetical protein
MKKKILSFLSILLIAVLGTSPVSAGPGIRLSGVQFSLGSLIATGYVSGIGNTNVTIVLDASGNADTICTNPGSNDVRGQSSPKVAAAGKQDVSGNQAKTKNGKVLFDRVETVDPIIVAWDVAGCPNAGWTAYVVQIHWTDALISVQDTATDQVLTSQSYTCDPALQTETTVSCVPVR